MQILAINYGLEFVKFEVMTWKRIWFSTAQNSYNNNKWLKKYVWFLV